MRIVAADIGGTRARFAIAELEAGRRPKLGAIRVYPCADHDGLPSAWAAFARDVGTALPRQAALGVAVGISDEPLRFPNSDWVIDPGALVSDLDLDDVLLINDFGAMAQAVTVLAPEEMERLHGPDGPLPAEGVTSVIGPGTGLGVAMILRTAGHLHLIETEGAHIGFAPLDEVEAAIERRVRERFGRCSVERVVSGPGLLEIHLGSGGTGYDDDIALWSAALGGTDPAAARSLDRLVQAFGSAAGDLALAQGANAVILSSGLSKRLAPWLRSPLFGERFAAKGRYRRRMEAMPVSLVLLDEPGLLGAAVAYQRRLGLALD